MSSFFLIYGILKEARELVGIKGSYKYLKGKLVE
jgi:hypothetical protein